MFIQIGSFSAHISLSILFMIICFACDSQSKCIEKEPKILKTINGKVNVFVDSTKIGKDLNHFWKSTGFCPPDPHNQASKYFLTPDMEQNLALISALPHEGINYVRIHFLYNLVSVIKDNQKKDSIDLTLDEQEIRFNFTLLDQFMKQIHLNRLRIGFELMGNPSYYFTNFEDQKQIKEWTKLVRETASRYIKLYGIEYVSSWMFESWNEPDILFRNYSRSDHINMTLKGFSNYYQACNQGLSEAFGNHSFILGGPGDHWPFKKAENSFVLSLLDDISSKKINVKLDFISLHEKGNHGNTSAIDEEEDKALEALRSRYPVFKTTPFVNNEGDPEAGWNKARWWRTDTSYAATIVDVISRRTNTWNDKHSNPLLTFSNDNSFLSFYPNQFTQRTLLARFQMNNTKPSHIRFVRKPAYAVMGLLSLLGNKLIRFKTDSNKDNSIPFNIISTAFVEQNKNSPTEFAIIFVSSIDATPFNGSINIRLGMDFNQTLMENSSDWKWISYTVDNIVTNPYNVFRNHHCPDYPTDKIFSEMRTQEEPFRNFKPRDLVLNGSRFDHAFKFRVPGVSLIHFCSKQVDLPEKVEGLRFIQVSKHSVLLIWNSLDSRCITTYEVERKGDTSRGQFERINKVDNIFSSYQNTGEPHGYYRVRAVDYWNRKGNFSDVIHVIKS